MGNSIKIKVNEVREMNSAGYTSGFALYCEHGIKIIAENAGVAKTLLRGLGVLGGEGDSVVHYGRVAKNNLEHRHIELKLH